MWICKNCENQNEENFRFCWSCGNSKSASRETVRGNTTELSFPKKVESAKKEIPQVKKLKTESKKDEIKIEEESPLEIVEKEFEKEEPIKIEVRTKEKPVFDDVEDEAEEITTQKPSKKAEKPKIKAPTSNIKQPEIFSTFSKTSEKAAEDETLNNKTDWQKEIFTIALRLIGLYFIFQVILALPDLVNLFYSTISRELSAEAGFAEYLFFYLSPFARYLFYLAVGMYLISSGKLLLRLLPRR